MEILIIDDSKDSILLIETILKKGGYTGTQTAESALEAYKILGINASKNDIKQIDLILLDIVMPEIDGIEAIQKIKSDDFARDIPIIMITAQQDDQSLHRAFNCGAIDYIKKPVNKVELLARVRSVLRLKYETDRRMQLMRELEEANRQLKRLTVIDGLTGISNRRHFDEFLEIEWRRNLRYNKKISLILGDIDYFKFYNDTYGHQAGDNCLKKAASVIEKAAKRVGDLAARYGGEEFALILSDTDSAFAAEIAGEVNKSVASLRIPHSGSKTDDIVTMSLGAATTIPSNGKSPKELIEAADEALYRAKENGRNRVEVIELPRSE